MGFWGSRGGRYRDTGCGDALGYRDARGRGAAADAESDDSASINTNLDDTTAAPDTTDQDMPPVSTSCAPGWLGGSAADKGVLRADPGGRLGVNQVRHNVGSDEATKARTPQPPQLGHQ